MNILDALNTTVLGPVLRPLENLIPARLRKPLLFVVAILLMVDLALPHLDLIGLSVVVVPVQVDAGIKFLGVFFGVLASANVDTSAGVVVATEEGIAKSLVDTQPPKS